MRAGGMRHRVQVMRRSTARTASGAQSTTYELLGERWAEVSPLSGREFFAAQQRGADVSTKFIMRKFAGLLPAMRLVWNAKIYDVKAILPDPVKDEMVVMANELVDTTAP